MAEKQGFFSRFVKSRRKSAECKCNGNATGATKGNSQVSRKFHRFPVRPTSNSEAGDIDLTQAFDGEYPSTLWREELPEYSTSNSEDHPDKEASVIWSMTAPNVSGISEGTKHQSRSLGKQYITMTTSNGNGFGSDKTNGASDKGPTLAAGIERIERKDEPPAGNSKRERRSNTEMEILSNFFEGIRDELVTAMDRKEKSRIRNRSLCAHDFSSSSMKQVSKMSAVQRSRPRDEPTPKSREAGRISWKSLGDTQGWTTEYESTLHIAKEFDQKAPGSIQAWRKSDTPFSFVPRSNCPRHNDDILEMRTAMEKKPVVKFSEKRAINSPRTSEDEWFLSNLCDELESDIPEAWYFDSSSSSASLATQESSINDGSSPSRGKGT